MMSRSCHWLLAPLPLLLVACGGGDSPELESAPNDAAPPVQETVLFENGPFPVPDSQAVAPIVPGEYRYTTQAQEPGEAPLDGSAIISGSGRIAISSPTSALLFARLESNSDGSFTAEISSDAANTDQEQLRIRGSINADDPGTINVVIENPADNSLFESATMTLQNPTSPQSLADVAGTYRDDVQLSPNGFQTTLTLNADGTLTGFDSSLCEYEGQYQSAPGSDAMFEISMTAQNCSAGIQSSAEDRNGEYKALMVTLPELDSIRVRAASSSNGFDFFGTEIDSPFFGGSFESDFVGTNFEITQTIAEQIDTGLFDYQEIALDTETDPDSLDAGVAIISPTGRLVIQTEEFDLRTKVDSLGANNSFRAQLTEFQSGESITVTGSINSEAGESTEIIGNIQDVDGALISRYRLTRNESVAELSATLGAVSGIYTGTDPVGEFTTTVVISNDGTFSGGDEACIFDGTTVTFDTGTPIFEARYTAEQCSSRIGSPDTDRNDTFNLVGILLDDGAGNKTIQTFIASNNLIETFTGSN